MKKNNKFTIMVLVCLILVSCIGFGSVYAYFSAKTKDVSGSITLGHLKISDLKTSDGASIDWNINNLQPNQEIGGSYKAEVDSNINYYIRMLFKANVSVTGKTHPTSCGDYVEDDTDILNIDMSDSGYTKSNTKSGDYTVYYKLVPQEASVSTQTFNIGIKPYNWVGAGSCDYYMGASVTLNMQVQVLQADYLESQNKGTPATDVATLHALWEKCLNVSGDTPAEEVKDVSEYPTLSFEVTDASAKTMSVSGNVGNSGALVIPARVLKDGETYTITSIPGKAFYSVYDLETVVIPETVTSISSTAFKDCSGITSITFKDTNGWYDVSGNNIDVTNPSTNATKLTLRDLMGVQWGDIYKK